MNFNASGRSLITDNAAALDCIRRLGLLPQVVHECRLPRQVIALKYQLHETHWILIFRFHAFDRVEENGYVVAAWPKAEFPEAVMDEHLAGFFAEQPVVSSPVPPPADPNTN